MAAWAPKLVVLALALALMPAPRASAQATTNAAAPGDEPLTELRVMERITSALDRAMEYMASKQKPDGGWPVGRNAPNAVALLAFQGRGHTPGRGPYREVLEKGKRFLISTQRDDGYYNAGAMYDHALTTLALTEMYGNDPDPKLEESVRKAVALIVKCQAPNGGWRYTPTPGDHDMSVTVMQIVALRAANNAEIPVPADTFAKAIAYVRSCASADGSFGYQPGGGGSVQLTAAGPISLQLLGQYQDPRIPKALDWLAKIPVQWGGGGVTYFYYFHYYAIQAHYQAGGKYWNAWHPKVRELLLSKQNADGSWPNFGNEGEDPYPTAMISLVLEIYMHFLPAYQR